MSYKCNICGNQVASGKTMLTVRTYRTVPKMVTIPPSVPWGTPVTVHATDPVTGQPQYRKEIATERPACSRCVEDKASGLSDNACRMVRHYEKKAEEAARQPVSVVVGSSKPGGKTTVKPAPVKVKSSSVVNVVQSRPQHGENDSPKNEYDLLSPSNIAGSKQHHSKRSVTRKRKQS